MSYQGSTLAAIVTDRNTWQSRANSAWGSSRVWNSGTSWESQYNSEVTAYNDMVTQRNTWQTNANTAYDSGTWGVGTSWHTNSDTWQSRANSAWGSSRVWNSGESWEAAYNRVLPPTGDVVCSGSVSLAGSMTGTPTAESFTVSSDPSALVSAGGASLTIAKAGNYVFYARQSGSYGVGNGQVNLVMIVNGVTQFTHSVDGARGWAVDVALRTGTLAAGATLQLQAWGTGGTTSGAGGTFELVLLPNQTHPH